VILIMPDLSIENNLQGLIAGVDEAGRGPWAGPVVAAAVILDQKNIPDGIDDSKKIKKSLHEKIYNEICKTAQVGIGIVTVEEIDEINILQASLLAMKKAIAALPVVPDFALIDGNKIPQGLPCKAAYVIGGDAKSLSIAAASLVAKVTRDRIMHELAIAHPQYKWESNAGYGTKDHQAGLAEFGVTAHHRRSFKPVAKILEEVELGT
jgi:ribonuclease HII